MLSLLLLQKFWCRVHLSTYRVQQEFCAAHWSLKLGFRYLKQEFVPKSFCASRPKSLIAQYLDLVPTTEEVSINEI